MEVALKAGGIAGCSGGEVDDLTIGEEDAEHGADLPRADGDTVLLGGFGDALDEGLGGVFEALVEAWLLEGLQGGDACGHSEGVPGEGTGLIDRTGGCELGHQFGGAAEGTDRQSTADDLAEAGQVGGDSEPFLGAPGGEAKSGHDLVKDEECPMAVGDGAECFQVPGLWKNDAGISDDRLDDDRGNFAGKIRKSLFYGPQVVVLNRNGFPCKGGRDACAVGSAEGGRATTGLNEEGIDVSVVAADTFDDFAAAGQGAGESDGGHGGLGPAVDHAHHLDGGHKVADHAGQAEFQRIGDTEAGTVFQGFSNLF